jgi:hypothetical protein
MHSCFALERVCVTVAKILEFIIDTLSRQLSLYTTSLRRIARRAEAGRLLLGHCCHIYYTLIFSNAHRPEAAP